MTFEQFIVRELDILGRSLTSRETAFLQAAEAAGFEMEMDNSSTRGLHFALETVEEDTMAYPRTAGVRVESLELLFADSAEIRATIRRLIADIEIT